MRYGLLKLTTYNITLEDKLTVKQTVLYTSVFIYPTKMHN